MNDVKRVIVVGDSTVGKTTVILAFSDGVVHIGQSLTTIGVDFKNKNVDLDGKQVKLQIWDTAGQERFRSIAVRYFKRADGICLFYDVTNRDSFDNLEQWLESIKEKSDEKVPIVLIGNKSDLENIVTFDEAQSLANKYNIPLYLTSAKTGEGIKEAFHHIARLMIETQKPEEIYVAPKPRDNPDNIKKGCCS